MEINRLHRILEALYKNNDNELALEILKENIFENIKNEKNEVENIEKITKELEDISLKDIKPEELDKEIGKILNMNLPDDLEDELYEKNEDKDYDDFI